jgi:hypothetical protein
MFRHRVGAMRKQPITGKEARRKLSVSGSSGIAWGEACNDVAEAEGERVFELCVGA